MATRTTQARFSFDAGELTPRLTMRGDMQRHASACESAENFIVTPHGGALYREGSRLVGFMQDAVNPARIFQFHRGGNESDIVVEVQAGSIRYWIDGELFEDDSFDIALVEEGTFEQLTDEDSGEDLLASQFASENPYSVSDLEDLYFTNQDKFGIICHPNHPPLYITFRRNDTVFTELLPFSRVPPFNYNDVNSPNVASTAATWQISFPTSWDFSGIRYVVRYNGFIAEGESGIKRYAWEYQPLDGGATTNNTNNLLAGFQNCLAQFGLGTVVGVVPIPAPITTEPTRLLYEVTFTGEGAGFEPQITTTDSPDQPIAVRVTSEAPAEEPAWSYPYVVAHDATGQLRFYQCIKPHRSDTTLGLPDGNEPGGPGNWQEFWTDIGNVPPSWYVYQHDNNNPWTTETNYSPWDRGWPTVCVFHQQRLVLMANEDNPTAVHGSAIGNYNQFVIGPNDDDPYLFIIDSSDTPKIKWAISQFNLLLGTSSGDWLMSGSDLFGAITPTEVQANKQNNGRSFKTRPEQIDTEIFYIEQGETNLRATRYVRNYQTFSTSEASLLSEHLLYGGIKRVAAMRIPDVLLFSLTKEGQILAMSYQKERSPQGIPGESAAWTPFSTDGRIVDICGYFSTETNEDSLYCLVERNGLHILEAIPYPERDFQDTSLSAKGLVHLDSWFSYEVEVPTLFVEVPDHLIGSDVMVLNNDIFVGSFTSVGNRIQLDKAVVGQVVVGLPYKGDLENFEHIQGNQMGVGFGTKRRWADLNVRLYNSAVPLINGTRPETRTPATPMGTSENIRLGIQNIEVTEIGRNDGKVKIVVDRPYPCHVLGIFGEFISGSK